MFSRSLSVNSERSSALFTLKQICLDSCHTHGGVLSGCSRRGGLGHNPLLFAGSLDFVSVVFQLRRLVSQGEM